MKPSRHRDEFAHERLFAGAGGERHREGDRHREKSPRAGVPIISDDADIPAGDHIISFVFKLRYADPIELQQVLGQYLSPPQTFTSFLALPKSSSIIVTENSSTIRSLVRIIDQVDIRRPRW